MMKFRSKLLLAIVSLIAFVVTLLSVLLVTLFERHNYKNFKDEQEKQVASIAAYVEHHGGVTAFAESGQVSSLEMTGSSVAIVTANGEILFMDNPPEVLSIDRHEANLTELAEAHTEEMKKVDGGLNLYYFPVTVIGSDSEIEGSVILTSELQDIKHLDDNAWYLIVATIGFSLAIIVIITNKIATRFTKPIEAATNTAIELAKGNFKARTYEDPSEETRLLSSSINVLARNLQEMEISQETQQHRLLTLIENIGSGVLLIDSKGYITLMNKTYKQLFNVSSNDYLYHLYYEVLQYEDVSHLIEEIFITEKSVKKQLVLSQQIERKHFEVYGAPIIGNVDEWKGIVLVFHDITELKRLEQMRQDFVANVSHELRTPITSVKGFSETLLDGDLKNEKIIRDFLTIILKESERMQALIQELLELSKIENQEFKLSLTKVDLNNIVSETEKMFNRKAEKKGIDLRLELCDDPVIIDADPYRLKQIFINLISNAINYTPTNGKVDVFVSQNEKYAFVEVKDTGVGIEKSEIPRIFERFYRVDRARSRNSGGTGLGLAIVKHLVEAHKGYITVESERGKGTSFIVRLRKRRK
ncbi:PAS domain-containing protein [Bacillus sp. AGMB 02131]|uniref:histidine kinase n=1 Tax=Peribacillus faecalis TaxID=2772559 RepID=A0A927CXQ2_9BACI|nr:HAMP domain-containing sensor histidine kinase [Peribacillus faecalis]MBD3109653.1 PAS domain-containing protein [Peribacillus faecalis]